MRHGVGVGSVVEVKTRVRLILGAVAAVAVVGGAVAWRSAEDSPVAVTARADVASEMNSFFSDVGGAANVTGPSAFQGQSAGYYSLGNV